MATPFVPYNPGTITVTNGSVNFTGSGTMLTAYEVGDAIIVDGNLCRIATIASNTAGTFALVYPGTTGSGKSYDWLPAADVTRAITLYASFQRLLVGGNLAALAALDGTGGNVYPRFTGAGTLDLRTFAQLRSDIAAQPSDSDLTAIAALTTQTFGRSLLTLADAAALRAASGSVIGTDVQAYDADLAAIAALATQSFGRSLLTTSTAAAAAQTLGMRVPLSTIADDTRVFQSLPTSMRFGGFIFVSPNVNGQTHAGLIWVRASSPHQCVKVAGGSAFNVYTSALAGTTGTDGGLNVSVAEDDLLRIENRIGGTVTPTVWLLY